MTGEDIRKVRAVMGMTLAEFAEKIGINEKYLSRIETGRDPVSPKVQGKVLILVIDTPEFMSNLRNLVQLSVKKDVME
jgi:Helix-turn-helix.